ncbi:MAG: hypothetical protein K9N47_05530 [Prosthecobacter sp.]|uniref:hypothetical protein n=1 Tax=Prosthecobacter sp. TaxID=1965333 RepID=UPI0025DDBAB4|nr:hypothetical protein [Prosthecobacter sp.]MCF7785561.1 hypothetical protein [Prosthecobacter sp.]
MTKPANTAYHECIERVELHQVTLDVNDQIEFITELRGQLSRKLTALISERRRRKTEGTLSKS